MQKTSEMIEWVCENWCDGEEVNTIFVTGTFTARKWAQWPEDQDEEEEGEDERDYPFKVDDPEDLDELAGPHFYAWTDNFVIFPEPFEGLGPYKLYAAPRYPDAIDMLYGEDE